MYDLHVHSLCSDGDLSPKVVVTNAKEKGLDGLALTDHNGIWGVEEAIEMANQQGMVCISGLEISTYYDGCDIHILGFASQFKKEILEAGLFKTREGCKERVSTMVEKCQQVGFSKVSIESIASRYATLSQPSFISFDVARELHQKYDMPIAQAHRMTVPGGVCYVPYGKWLLSPQEAISLLHSAGGVAVLAHPGIIIHEAGEGIFKKLVADLEKAHLDGLEVRHPFHSAELTDRLATYSGEQGLLVTAGSDWHGPSRFVENNQQFGKIGASEEEWTHLLHRCAELV